MRVNTNLAALNTWKSLTSNQANMSKSLERLSSGYRINRAADDAAGLAVSEKMKAQVRGLNMATRNAQDGVSLVQTAEGGASKIQDMLQRMRELAVQSNTGTLATTDQALLDKEFQELFKEIDRTANTAKFNGINLIGTTGASVTFQVGSGTTADDSITATLGDLTTAGANLNLTGAKIDSAANAKLAIDSLDTAINSVSTERAKMGAMQNRLENAISTLQTQGENLTAAESRIRDVDMAAEMAQFTKFQVLSQASTAMLAQANQIGQGVLTLLR